MLWATISGARPVAWAMRRAQASRSATMASMDAPCAGSSVMAAQAMPRSLSRRSHGAQTARLQKKPWTSTMPTWPVTGLAFCPAAGSPGQPSASAWTRKGRRQPNTCTANAHSASQAAATVRQAGTGAPALRTTRRINTICRPRCRPGQHRPGSAPASASPRDSGHHHASQAMAPASVPSATICRMRAFTAARPP